MGEEITSTTASVPYDDQSGEEVEKEEALSLCDLPIDLDANNNSPGSDHMEKTLLGRSRRSSSEAAPEFFEFLSDVRSDMCPADDIIFCGKLIPLKQQPLPFQAQQVYQKSQNHVIRKRSESLSELRSSSITRSNSSKNSSTNTLLRNSRSLDYQKLYRSDMERNLSTRSVEKPEFSPKRAVKRRWYVFMFGMVKFPQEMELKDIKSRQFRRSPSAMFPTLEEEDGGNKFAGNRSSGKGSCSSWNLLKALSCKDHASVAITSSFEMPLQSSLRL